MKTSYFTLREVDDGLRQLIDEGALPLNESLTPAQLLELLAGWRFDAAKNWGKEKRDTAAGGTTS